MATFLATIQFTEQGVREIARTTDRASAFETAAQRAGANVLHQYWMLGEVDGLLIFDAKDDEAAATLMMQLGSLGNVRTKTCRAFTAKEMSRMLAGA